LLHESLAQPTSASKARNNSPAKDVPEWFASMDANQDGDLARGEFSGTSEQFQSLDRDKDGLISAAEALVQKE
jgi:Ca2+-binding EF-hand superfamily protein